jgi:hypothetical protein
MGGSYINMGSVAIWEVPDPTHTSLTKVTLKEVAVKIALTVLNFYVNTSNLEKT